MDSLHENKTWELVKLPEGRTTLQNNWVYKIEHEGEGKTERCKARLLVNGFSQTQGIHFIETFHLLLKYHPLELSLVLLLL